MDWINSLVLLIFVVLGGISEAKYAPANKSDSEKLSTRSTYSCGTPVIVDTRVVGGNESLAGKFPWQVLFKGLSSTTGSYTSTCGGSVLSNQWVVTAAHCTPGRTPETIHVVLGDFNKDSDDSGNDKEFAVAAIYDHPDYVSASTSGYDVSLLKLGGNAVYSDYIIPVCLPTQGVNVATGTVCWVTGWGTESEGGSTATNMREARVPIIDQSSCASWYGSVGLTISQNMVCAGFDAGGVDTCQGDSGGPLVCQDSNVYYLEGVTSWGVGCARPERPGVYARVSEVRSWIDTTMASNAATETFFGYPTTACGSTITTAQILRLPVDSETQLYTGSMNCVWTVTPPNTTESVRLTFVERFAVEPISSCSDYVSIATATGTQIGDAKICGLTLPSALTSSTRDTAITVTFVSDFTGNFEGFAINVEFLTESTSSGSSRQEAFLLNLILISLLIKQLSDSST